MLLLLAHLFSPNPNPNRAILSAFAHFANAAVEGPAFCFAFAFAVGVACPFVVIP
jgi:hypothetical protein